MRASALLVEWHGKQPLYSVSFQPGSDRVATGGSEVGGGGAVKIWRVTERNTSTSDDDDSCANIEFLSDLQGHNRCVNVVRFSPDGKLLASAGDDGMVMLWHLDETSSADAPKPSGNLESLGSAEFNKEKWKTVRAMKGHTGDVVDACWSPCSRWLITGSIDNLAIVWDVEKGSIVKRLSDHKHYVQGVAWDPRAKLLATESSDRTVRVYRSHLGVLSKKRKVFAQRFLIKQLENQQNEQSAPHRLFLDESVCTTVRRPSFSPCGSLLALPTGAKREGSEIAQGTYLFARGQLSKPLAFLPHDGSASLATAFAPVFLRKRTAQGGTSGVVPELPYRMLFAVATPESVLIYDTECDSPIVWAKGFHPVPISDISWSSDGRFLMVASKDGFCSVVILSEEERGPVLPQEELPERLREELRVASIGELVSQNRKGTGAKRGPKPKRRAEEDPSVARGSARESSEGKLASDQSASGSRTRSEKYSESFGENSDDEGNDSEGRESSSASSSASFDPLRNAQDATLEYTRNVPSEKSDGDAPEKRRRIQPTLLTPKGAAPRGAADSQGSGSLQPRRIIPTLVSASSKRTDDESADAAGAKRRIVPTLVSPSND